MNPKPKVRVINSEVLSRNCSFNEPFKFQITYHCFERVKDELKVQLTYVGSAESEEYDQILDTFYVSALEEGTRVFTFESNGPDMNKIPRDELLGVTVILISLFYHDQEFNRIGYFVTTEYKDEEYGHDVPENLSPDRINRKILTDKTRNTLFKINWDDEPFTTPAMFNSCTEAADDDDADNDDHIEKTDPEKPIGIDEDSDDAMPLTGLRATDYFIEEVDIF